MKITHNNKSLLSSEWCEEGLIYRRGLTFYFFYTLVLDGAQQGALLQSNMFTIDIGNKISSQLFFFIFISDAVSPSTSRGTKFPKGCSDRDRWSLRVGSKVLGTKTSLGSVYTDHTVPAEHQFSISSNVVDVSARAKIYINTCHMYFSLIYTLNGLNSCRYISNFIEHSLFTAVSSLYPHKTENLVLRIALVLIL